MAIAAVLIVVFVIVVAAPPMAAVKVVVVIVVVPASPSHAVTPPAMIGFPVSPVPVPLGVRERLDSRSWHRGAI
jgi:hypothetical protein